MIWRAALTGLALIFVVAFWAPTTVGAKAKRIASEVEIDAFDVPPPDFDFTFVGDVHSKKSKCERNREVSVFFTEGGANDFVGSTTTDHTGDWELVHESVNDASEYTAEVARKKTGKRGNRLICKADSSTYFVPD